jgi:hypothetical protein
LATLTLTTAAVSESTSTNTWTIILQGIPCLKHASGLLCQCHRSGNDKLWTLAQSIVCHRSSYTRAPSGTTMRCCTAFVPKLPCIVQPVLRAAASAGRPFGSQ